MVGRWPLDALLRGLVLPYLDYWDIPFIALFEYRIFVDVDLVQRGPELAQHRGDRGFGFLTKVTSWARVQSHVSRATARKPRIFGRVVRTHG